MKMVEVKNIVVSHYQVWSEMSFETFGQLVSDIKANGVTYPILLDENFVILDGHHRYKAAKSAGLELVPCIVKIDLTEEQKIELAHTANSNTRTISIEEKKKKAAQLRSERRSLRQIASWLGVGKSTIERWLRDSGQGVPRGTDSRINGSDGKQYPPKQERRKSASESSSSEMVKEIARLKEQNRLLAASNQEKQRTIEKLQRDIEAERKFKSSFSFSDKSMGVFAEIVGVATDSSAYEIDRAFRKARAKAHPDGGGNDWVSQRYNSTYDMFRRLHKTS